MTERALDPERLAALLDGRLEEAEREQLLARLTESEDDLAAYGDAAAILAELQGDAIPRVATATPAARRRWFRSPALPLAAAAIVALAIAVPVARRALRERGAGDPVALAALLGEGSSASALANDRVTWSGMRGAATDMPAHTRAVRLGARLVDLRVAVVAGAPSARPVAQEIADILEVVPGGAGIALEFDRFARGGAPMTAQWLRGATHDVMTLSGEDYARLGALAEAARLAARARRSSFFAEGYFRASLARARRIPALDAGLRADLDRMAQGAAASSPDWVGIEAAAEDVLDGIE